MTQKVTVYGSPVCHMVAPVRRTLNRANVNFEYIDIFQSPQARERIRQINHGNESVPTLIFPDGSTLTEPSLGQLNTKLASLGYTVPALTWFDQVQLFLENPLVRLFGIIALVFGVINTNYALIIVGIILIGASFLLNIIKK